MPSKDGYFTVNNLDKFQHYKDRTPPWIKLHNCILEDYDFACLQDASKAHLMLIWLLASRTEGGKVRWDEDWVGQRIGARSPVDLTALSDAGFLTYHDASGALATCPQRERERERESRGEGEAEFGAEDQRKNGNHGRVNGKAELKQALTETLASTALADAAELYRAARVEHRYPVWKRAAWLRAFKKAEGFADRTGSLIAALDVATYAPHRDIFPKNSNGRAAPDDRGLRFLDAPPRDCEVMP